MSLGTHNLTSLPGFTINFSFLSGSNFSNANITTPLTGVAVRIEDAGSGVQRLFFTESGGAGSNGGPFQGALDLSNGVDFLTFEPTFSGGNFLYASGNNSGRYLALSSGAVPEPATWAMMILGFGLIGGAMRRKQRQVVRFDFA